MSDLFTFALSIFTGFFAVMNPVANIPVFLGLVAHESDASKKQIAQKACMVAFIIVVTFILLGKYIFELFGITIPAFKIAGGILLFYVGFEMLQAKKSNISHQENIPEDDTAISPLAIPVLAGPGTIVTGMNKVANADFLHISIIILVFAFMILLTYLAFSLSEVIMEKVGKSTITVIGKIMGLILTIMSTGMIIQGIQLAFNLR